MSEIKNCHFCGKTFEDKRGFQESPRVKDTKFGSAYAVCSIKCQRDHEEYKNRNSRNTTPSTNPEDSDVTSSEVNVFRIKLIFGFFVLVCIIVLIKYFMYGNINDALFKDPFK